MQFSRRRLKEFVTLARQTFGIAPRGTGPRVWFSERAAGLLDRIFPEILSGRVV